jgi:L-threonylcarbamoyladenylate synthase
MEKKLPGPYTFLVEKNFRMPGIVTGGSKKLGVRIPDAKITRELARRAGPIITTSANVSGKPTPATFKEIERNILDSADIALDAGDCGSGVSSEVMDLTREDRPRLR